MPPDLLKDDFEFDKSFGDELTVKEKLDFTSKLQEHRKSGARSWFENPTRAIFFCL